MTPEQRRTSSQVVYYELETLIASRKLNLTATQRLAIDGQDILARTAKTCSLESFLVHYRNLKQFLANKGQADDVKAADFIPGWNGDKFPWDPKEKDRINKLLQHIDCDRKALQAGDWDGRLGAMEEVICAAFEEFVAKADKSYTEFSDRMAKLLRDKRAQNVGKATQILGSVSNSTTTVAVQSDIFSDAAWQWHKIGKA